MFTVQVIQQLKESFCMSVIVVITLTLKSPLMIKLHVLCQVEAFISLGDGERDVHTAKKTITGCFARVVLSEESNIGEMT